MATPPQEAVTLRPGDLVRFVGGDGRVLEGRLARADLLRRADGGAGPWTMFVVPAEEAGCPPR
jgi:hypothetical protein